MRNILKRALTVLLPFHIAGVLFGEKLATHGDCSSILWPSALCMIGLNIFLSLKKNSVPAFLYCIMFFLIGAASSNTLFSPPDHPAHVINFVDEKDLVFGGIITQQCGIKNGRLRLIVDADEVVVPGGESKAVYGNIYLTIQGDLRSFETGRRIRFPARLRKIYGFANPGVFNYQRYMNARNVWVDAFLKTPRLITYVYDPEASPSLMDDLRAKLSKFIDRTTGRPARGLFKALYLGSQDELDEEMRSIFRKSGLAHLLAISGLHIGVIALFSFRFFKWLLLLRPRLALRFDVIRISYILSLFPVLFYAVLAGGRPATTRAAIMVAIFIFAIIIQRSKDPLTALAAAAWAITACQPGIVFSASFQLSFAAAGAIILLAPEFPASPFRRFKDVSDSPRSTGAIQRLWGLTIVTLSATIGTAPLVAWHFQKIALFSLPANLIITPIVSMIIVPFGLVGVSASLVSPTAAAFILETLERLAWIIIISMEKLSSIPNAEIQTITPSLLTITLYYAFILTVFLVKPRPVKIFASIFLAAALLASIIAPLTRDPDRSDLDVVFLDVGQGNSTYLHFPDGTRMIIDGGGFAGSGFDTGESIVAPFLLNKGAVKLDIAVMTHSDVDHSGGLGYLVKEFNPSEFWFNGEPFNQLSLRSLSNELRRPSVKLVSPPDLPRGRRFGDVTVDAFAPLHDAGPEINGGQPITSDNDKSLVLKIKYRDVAFLFPGDIEAQGETMLASCCGESLKSDVLLASHHGGSSSMSEAFLDAVRPRFVVFSVGRNNRFGFPSVSALERAEKIGAEIFRTDRDGAVIAKTNGKNLEIRAYRN